MAGSYFDFSNTPITKDTSLKAKWCCGEPATPELWDGSWAGGDNGYVRWTLTDGKVLVTDRSDYKKYLNPSDSTMSIGGTSSDGAGVAFYPDRVAKIDISPKAYANDVFVGLKYSYPYFTNLVEVNANLINVIGISDGSLTIMISTSSEVKGTILLGDKITAGGIQRVALFGGNVFTGVVVVNCPMESFYCIKNNAIYDRALPFSTSTANGAYPTSSITVIGKYADDLLATFPNQNGTSYYRNLVKG